MKQSCFTTVFTKMPGGATRDFYMGGNGTEAYIIAGTITGMLHELRASGMVQVFNTDGDNTKVILSEVWENGKEVPRDDSSH